jgi:hypothetical protein
LTERSSQSLAELLAPEKARSRRHPVEVVLEMLEGEELQAVQAALGNAAFGNAQIARALREVGYDISDKQVGSYRSSRRIAQFAGGRREG